MKTLKEIEKEIAEQKTALKELRESREDKSEAGINNKISFLKKAKIYLEFNPVEKHVETQKNNVTKWLKIIDDRYKQWLEQDGKRKRISNPREVFNEQCEIDLKEVSRWKQELKFVNYILS